MCKKTPEPRFSHALIRLCLSCSDTSLDIQNILVCDISGMVASAAIVPLLPFEYKVGNLRLYSIDKTAPEHNLLLSHCSFFNKLMHRNVCSIFMKVLCVPWYENHANFCLHFRKVIWGHRTTAGSFRYPVPQDLFYKPQMPYFAVQTPL